MKTKLLVLTLSSGILMAIGLRPAQTDSRRSLQAEKLIRQCLMHLEKNEADQAVYFGERAVQLDEKNTEYHLRLGQAYGLKARQVNIFKKFFYAKKCLAEWEKAVELDGRNAEARFMLVEYYLQAPAIAGGSKKKAGEQAEEIIKMDPVRGHLALARIHEAGKDPAKAEFEYKKVLELDPQHKQAQEALKSLKK